MTEQPPDFGYFNQPYVAEVLRQFADMPTTPGLHHVMILHDDWCTFLTGTGLCVCNPIVRRPNQREQRQLEKIYGKNRTKESKP